MGDVDITVKSFIKIRSVFSQLFSEGVFHGEVDIDPDKLQELDTVNQETIKLADGQLKNLERLRDAQKITMLFDDKMAFQIIMGVEAQTGVHYYMPVRCMELDALSYSYQCRAILETSKENKMLKKYSDGVPKGTKIIPVVTVVFYLGEKPWDGPVSVYDMLDIPDDLKDRARSIVPDYRMNLIDARHISDNEVDKFSGDLKAFLLLLRKQINKEKFKQLVVMHQEMWYALSKITGDQKYIEYIESIPQEERGGIDMRTALDYFIAEGEAKGRAEGEAKGRAEGRAVVNKLGVLLTNAGRAADFLKSLSDPEYQKKLFIEFGLEKNK